MLSYLINEWCKMHGISRGFFYKLQKLGEAPQTFKVGSLTRISEDANRYWVQERESRDA